MWIFIFIFLAIAAAAGAGNAEAVALLQAIVHFAHDAILAISQALQS